MSGRQARRLLRHLRTPTWGSIPVKQNHHHHQLQQQQRQHSRAHVGTRPLPTKFKDASSQFALSPPAALAAASAGSSSSSYASRKGFVSWYLGMIEARPVLTKSLTAGFIFTVADLSSQVLTRKWRKRKRHLSTSKVESYSLSPCRSYTEQELELLMGEGKTGMPFKTISLTPSVSFDLIRTSRMAGFGILISGPTLHLWFNFLSKTIPKRDIINTLKKMLLGQTVYGPIIATVFFSLNAALQGETGAEIVARLKRDLLPTFINGLVYWPMCDFVTFRFVPVRLQPLVSNSFSFLWTIYITYMASLGKASACKIASD